jgi:DNA uptake protein ComE-like DNA-binding protein
MWETIRGYLTFTRKERFGVLFLLILISILFILPYFFRPTAGDPDPEAYEKMKDGIRKFESRFGDSSLQSYKQDRYPGHQSFRSETFPDYKDRSPAAEMFYFDPNTISTNDWKRLGLSEHLTQTIQHYIEKGGRFRKAEDLKKLYGLRPDAYERLLPYVRIPKTPDNIRARSGYYAKSVYNLPGVKKADSFFNTRPARLNYGPEFSGKNMEPTDINLADSVDWSRLPGIGAKLASRIVHFREKLGGFFQVDQVAETFGLPDSTFQKIKPFLRMSQTRLIQLDLNNATKESLQAHPYIRWQVAREIIAFRIQHGGYHSVDELLQLVQMDPVKFEKIKPYLSVKP